MEVRLFRSKPQIHNTMLFHFSHGNNYHNHDKRMETLKAWNSVLDWFLGCGFVSLTIYHFTFEDVRSIVLLIGSAAFITVKTFDGIEVWRTKRAKRKEKELDIKIKAVQHELEQHKLDRLKDIDLG